MARGLWASLAPVVALIVVLSSASPVLARRPQAPLGRTRAIEGPPRPRGDERPRGEGRAEMSGTALMTFVGVTEGQILVVAAGPRTPALLEVSDTIIARLRAGGWLHAVLDGAELGGEASATNRELVGRSRGAAVERVLIVRVTGFGAQRVIYADSYDPDGRRYAGFVLGAGETLAPHVDPRASAKAQAEVFVPAKAQAKAQAVVAGSNDISDAEREYLERALYHPRDVVLRGIYRDPMRAAAALVYMDNRALLERDARRKRARVGLGMTAVTVGLPAMVISSIALAGFVGEPGLRGLYYANLGTLSVGALLSIGGVVGIALRPVILPGDMEAEVARYNHNLRSRLGLAEDIDDALGARTAADAGPDRGPDAGSPRPRAPSPRARRSPASSGVVLVPVPMPLPLQGGAGLVLSGRF